MEEVRHDGSESSYGLDPRTQAPFARVILEEMGAGDNLAPLQVLSHSAVDEVNRGSSPEVVGPAGHAGPQVLGHEALRAENRLFCRDGVLEGDVGAVTPGTDKPLAHREHEDGLPPIRIEIPGDPP